MATKIKRIILYIISILAVICFSSAYSVIAAINYKGSDFLAGNNYGYLDNFSNTLKKKMINDCDIYIQDGFLYINQGAYTDTVLYDEEGIPYFEIKFVNCSDEEFDVYYRKHFAKSYEEISPRSRNYSFALFGNTKMCSYIYSPERYESYKTFDKKIVGDYREFDSKFDFKQFINGDNNTNDFIYAFDKFGANIEKKSMIEQSINVVIFSLVAYLMFKIFVYIFAKDFVNLKSFLIDFIVVCITQLINVFLIHFDGIEIVLIFSYILSTVIYMLLRRERNA